MPKTILELDRCPICDEIYCVGYLGGTVCKRYFCENCLVEFSVRRGCVKIYDYDEEGMPE